MDLKLAGKTALVTGSSKGIGEAIALALAREGASVIVHGRQASQARQVAERITAAGGQACTACGDIAGEDGVEAVLASAIAQAGPIDILVNNAGGSSAGTQTWNDSHPEHWRATFQRNVLSTAQFSARVVPAMRARRWGRILNIASVAALMPPAVNPDYAAAKAAVVAMTASLSKAVAAEGITVNAVSPGTIHSARLEARFRDIAAQAAGAPVDDWHEVQQRVLPLMGGVPAGRVGTLDELADVATFLCSPLAAYVTGINLRVDGGMFVGI
ncbi:SDR family NAD(P)-dependent oxidoreductase [Stenotrophomonas sp. 24(2023)]|uniref:SDR family NAD(P)-dependent oxidoreductase n=1 Tax=Stenotrophomonas sp. 24(2023) TaxID=3068324 RepID=UPI0027DF182D|nr:SDR family NAD(P)-dependent oxidoreductase [Stenotrophomonas sp. 24(2023)]WMJ68239.1 SDR family NAD(P)-dependent oxidoreductase [Stenotrophomonas sp. 24(2023)]